MDKKLIQIILDGSAEERENAARQICQSRKKDTAAELVNQLHLASPSTREIIAIITGVFGGKDNIQNLTKLSKTDPEANVRIAAIISRQFAGKMTFDQLRSEIRNFHKDESPVKQKEIQEKQPVENNREKQVLGSPEMRSISARETKEENDDPKREMSLLSKFQTKKVLSIAVLVTIVLMIALISKYVILNGNENKQIVEARRMSIGAIIKERFTAIEKFKSTNLNPENPASKYPMTLEIRTVSGDVYGDLFEAIYGNVMGTEIGMNTLGAFWRHVNFGNDKMQNLADLMEQETSGELLLFPNPAALNMILDVENGSLSYQTLNNFDPDLVITIRVDNVVVR